jgi:hypothetical protein
MSSPRIDQKQFRIIVLQLKTLDCFQRFNHQMRIFSLEVNILDTIEYIIIINKETG